MNLGKTHEELDAIWSHFTCLLLPSFESMLKEKEDAVFFCCEELTFFDISLYCDLLVTLCFLFLCDEKLPDGVNFVSYTLQSFETFFTHLDHL